MLLYRRAVVVVSFFASLIPSASAQTSALVVAQASPGCSRPWDLTESQRQRCIAGDDSPPQRASPPTRASQSSRDCSRPWDLSESDRQRCISAASTEDTSSQRAAPSAAPTRAPTVTAEQGDGRPTARECFRKIQDIHSRMNDRRPLPQLYEQKALFEGECSHHPQAREYVVQADQAIRREGGSAGASQPSPARDASSNNSRSPANHPDTGRGPTVSYKDPATGKDCIQSMGMRRALTDDYRHLAFKNICSTATFHVNIRYADGTDGGGGYIRPGDERTFTCRVAQCQGATFSFKL